jgi:hypothetical protein
LTASGGGAVKSDGGAIWGTRSGVGMSENHCRTESRSLTADR